MAKTDGSDLMKKTNGETPLQTIPEWIESLGPQIAMALPKDWNKETMVAAVINAMRTNPNLAPPTCTRISLLCAVLTAAQLGLRPNTPMGQCYIIPYFNSKIRRYEAQFQLGYKGILEMGYRSDTITEIYAEKVKKGDDIDWQKGTEKYIHHREHPDKWEFDKNGELIITHYYAIYKTTKGGMAFVIWTKDMIMQHKNRYSPASRKDAFSPWSSAEDLMAQKTVLKDVMRYASLSEKDRRILSADETVKREISNNMLDVPAVYEFNPDDTKGMDDVKFKGQIDTAPEDNYQETSGQEIGTEKGKTQELLQEPGEYTAGQQGQDTDTEADAAGQKLDTRPATESQIKMMFSKGRAIGYETPAQLEEFRSRVKERFKIQHLYQIARFQFALVNQELDARLKANKDAAEIEQGFNDAEQKEMI